jgi:hypothetical protein
MEYQESDCYALKSLIGDLFGEKAWIEIKHSTDLSRWKKYCKRLLSSIECSAKQTVKVADDERFGELSNTVKFGKTRINGSENFEGLFSGLSTTLATISFLQLGKVPCHIRRNSVKAGNNNNWDLSETRSVQYVQSTNQKLKKHGNSAIQDKLS